MTQLPVITLVFGEDSFELDLNRFMLTESMALESEWGLTTDVFLAGATGGNPPQRIVGAMVWLARVRAIARTEGISFPEARKRLPVETFDVDLMAMKVVADGEAPENPTGSGTRTKGTRTTPATSARKSKAAA